MTQSVLTDAIDRVTARIEALGAIGRNPETGGLKRFLYTPELREARALVARWMADVGMAVREDAVGNLFGRIEGTGTGTAVVTGSHIDTVIEGGRYDGALGVIASLTAVETLYDRYGPPRRAVEVLAICDEEGGRFHTNFWGSRAVVGGVTPEEAASRFDADGISLAEAMRADGYDPDGVAAARREDIGAWLELHIEQGRVLEASGTNIAVVTSIAGHALREVRVAGREDHAGTAPMDLRRDALAGAAEMVGLAVDEARRLGPPAVCTTGKLRVLPGIANVVPAEAVFTLDIRDGVAERLAQLLHRIDEGLRAVADRRRLELSVTELVRRLPTPLDAELSRLLHDCAGEAGISAMSMPSMAGHDSEVMAKCWPSAMLFVPSRDGRSHTPAEYTAPEHIAPGLAVLTEALRRLIY